MRYIMIVMLYVLKFILPYKLYMVSEDLLTGFVEQAEEMTPDWSAYDIGRVLSFIFILVFFVFDVFLITTLITTLLLYI